MHRIVCEEFGDPEGLRLVEQPTPVPGPGELLLEVEAAGVSFVDGLIVRGAYQVRPPLPFTPGSCVVGVVADGSRVATVLGMAGGFASHALVPEDAVVPVPPGLSPELAAASMEGYLTLAFATTHRVRIEPGEQVVVLGAGGGIGLAAVDVARSLGAQVTAVASTEEKRTAALRAGAERAIGYDDLKDGIRAATGGGADVVFDPVGGPAAEAALRALGTGGRYCVVGFASGEIPRLPSNVVLLRNRSIVGIDWGDWSREVAGARGNADLLADVFARIADGSLHPPAPTVAPLADAGRVLRALAERRAVGKHVLRP